MTFTQLNGLFTVLDSGDVTRAPRRLDHLRPSGTNLDTNVAVQTLDPPAPCLFAAYWPRRHKTTVQAVVEAARDLVSVQRRVATSDAIGAR